MKEGAYISFTFRWTKHEHRWPCFKYHVFVTPRWVIEKYAESYVPDKKTLGDWPCPLFRGFIKKGDN